MNSSGWKEVETFDFIPSRPSAEQRCFMYFLSTWKYREKKYKNKNFKVEYYKY